VALDRSPLGEFEIRGEWWLPENPANCVPGVLSYSPGHWVKVELDKPLSDPWVDTEPGIRELSLDQRPFDTLLGAGKDGTLCTLLEGFEIAGTTAYARSLLIGQHFARATDVRFRSAELGLTHLERWTEHSPFAFPITELAKGAPEKSYRLEIAYRGKKLLDIAVPSTGCRIEVWSGTDVTYHVYQSVTIKHAPFVYVEPSTPQSFSWYREFFLNLTRLFSFLVGCRLYRTKTVCFAPPNGEEVEPSHVEVYDQMRIAAILEEPHPIKMPLPFSLVQNSADRVFEGWFSTAKELAAVHQLLLETLPPCDLGLESVLIRLAQALEVFYRRSVKGTYVTQEEYQEYYKNLVEAFPEKMPDDLKYRLRNHLKFGNEYSLNSLVKHLIRSLDKVAQDALCIEDPAEFALRVARTGNTLTHHTPADGPVASTATEYYEMNKQLRALLYGVLAQSLGFNGAVLRQCVDRARAYT